MCSDKVSDGFVKIDQSTKDLSSREKLRESDDDEGPKEVEFGLMHSTEQSDSLPAGIRTVDEVNRGDDDEDDEDESDFEDETLLERLEGLAEMFPDWVRNGTKFAFNGTVGGLQTVYGVSRSLAWFAASTSIICIMPLMLELERQQMEEQEAADQRSMMLGTPGAAGGGLAGFQTNLPILTPAMSK